MDLFVVILYILCEDPYYGFDEHLECIFFTFEQAKQYVDSFLLEHKDSCFREYKDNNGDYNKSFIEIYGMEWGDTNKKTLFSSNT